MAETSRIILNVWYGDDGLFRWEVDLDEYGRVDTIASGKHEDKIRAYQDGARAITTILKLWDKDTR